MLPRVCSILPRRLDIYSLSRKNYPKNYSKYDKKIIKRNFTDNKDSNSIQNLRSRITFNHIVNLVGIMVAIVILKNLYNLIKDQEKN